MLTEQQIRDLADRHGLAVDKRITTGERRTGHFAEFVLYGPEPATAAAYAEVRPAFYPRAGFLAYASPTNPDYPDRRPFVEFSSVWCLPEV